MIFYWNPSNNKSVQVSRTLLSILANLNNTVILMDSACPLIPNSSGSFFKLFGVILSTPIAIIIFIIILFIYFLFLYLVGNVSYLKKQTIFICLSLSTNYLFEQYSTHNNVEHLVDIQEFKSAFWTRIDDNY